MSHPSHCLWQMMARVWVNHRWLFLCPCSGPTGEPGCNYHLFSPRWQRAGTVKKTGRQKKGRIESGLPCGFLWETVSICWSGPNLTRLFTIFFYTLLYEDLSMHAPRIQPVFSSQYRISPHLHSLCAQHFADNSFTDALKDYYVSVCDRDECFCSF